MPIAPSRRRAPECRARSKATRHLFRLPLRLHSSRVIASIAPLALAIGCASAAQQPSPSNAHSQAPVIATTSEVAAPVLTEGWLDFVSGLEDARRAIEDPAYYPPSPTDRNLAEGYRYLLGHLTRIIEQQTQADPEFPYFQRAVRMLSKWTIDNPDTMYLSAAISPEGVYRIRGQALDTQTWRTGERDLGGPRAPRVVIFQTTTAVVGQTGELAEMSNCRNQTLDSVDQFQLELDADGRFEILVAAVRPADYRGHFLASRGEAPCPTPFGTLTYRTRDATQLNVREIFSDWNSEIPLDLEIVRLDRRGLPRPPRTSAEMGVHLSEIGRLVGNQIKFWNRLHELGLEVSGDRNGDGRTAFPVNDLNPPAAPFIAGGTAGAGQLYAAGTFALDDEHALVIRVECPVEPHYVGFQLSNLWGESPDQANYVSSQTGSQNPPASDGARYYIVSSRDPGTPGWLDTTGLDKMTMSMRFIFRTPPTPAQTPTLESTVVRLEDVWDLLPEDTRVVTPSERLREVDQRQRHIQRRFRQY